MEYCQITIHIWLSHDSKKNPQNINIQSLCLLIMCTFINKLFASSGLLRWWLWIKCNTTSGGAETIMRMEWVYNIFFLTVTTSSWINSKYILPAHPVPLPWSRIINDSLKHSKSIISTLHLEIPQGKSFNFVEYLLFKLNLMLNPMQCVSL